MDRHRRQPRPARERRSRRDGDPRGQQADPCAAQDQWQLRGAARRRPAGWDVQAKRGRPAARAREDREPACRHGAPSRAEAAAAVWRGRGQRRELGRWGDPRVHADRAARKGSLRRGGAGDRFGPAESRRGADGPPSVPGPVGRHHPEGRRGPALRRSRRRQVDRHVRQGDDVRFRRRRAGGGQSAAIAPGDRPRPRRRGRSLGRGHDRRHRRRQIEGRGVHRLAGRLFQPIRSAICSGHGSKEQPGKTLRRSPPPRRSGMQPIRSSRRSPTTLPPARSYAHSTTGSPPRIARSSVALRGSMRWSGRCCRPGGARPSRSIHGRFSRR
jgi:hypothetical protein